MTIGQDAFGNYRAALPAEQVASGAALGNVTIGIGAPTGSPNSPDAVYIDRSTGNVYSNNNGAWTLSSASNVQAAVGVYSWDGTGAKPTATGPGILVGKGAQAGNYWSIDSAGTGWVQFISV